MGWGAVEVERRCRAVREGWNAETCQKRAPGPPFGMWPVCLPRKYRAVEREEKGKKRKGRGGKGRFCLITEGRGRTKRAVVEVKGR